MVMNFSPSFRPPGFPGLSSTSHYEQRPAFHPSIAAGAEGVRYAARPANSLMQPMPFSEPRSVSRFSEVQPMQSQCHSLSNGRFIDPLPGQQSPSDYNLQHYRDSRPSVASPVSAGRARIPRAWRPSAASISPAASHSRAGDVSCQLPTPLSNHQYLLQPTARSASYYDERRHFSSDPHSVPNIEEPDFRALRRAVLESIVAEPQQDQIPMLGQSHGFRYNVCDPDIEDTHHHDALSSFQQRRLPLSPSGPLQLSSRRTPPPTCSLTEHFERQPISSTTLEPYRSAGEDGEGTGRLVDPRKCPPTIPPPLSTTPPEPRSLQYLTPHQVTPPSAHHEMTRMLLGMIQESKTSSRRQQQQQQRFDGKGPTDSGVSLNSADQKPQMPNRAFSPLADSDSFYRGMSDRPFVDIARRDKIRDVEDVEKLSSITFPRFLNDNCNSLSSTMTINRRLQPNRIDDELNVAPLGPSLLNSAQKASAEQQPLFDSGDGLLSNVIDRRDLLFDGSLPIEREVSFRKDPLITDRYLSLYESNGFSPRPPPPPFRPIDSSPVPCRFPDPSVVGLEAATPSPFQPPDMSCRRLAPVLSTFNELDLSFTANDILNDLHPSAVTVSAITQPAILPLQQVHRSNVDEPWASSSSGSPVLNGGAGKTPSALDVGVLADPDISEICSKEFQESFNSIDFSRLPDSPLRKPPGLERPLLLPFTSTTDMNAAASSLESNVKATTTFGKQQELTRCQSSFSQHRWSPSWLMAPITPAQIVQIAQGNQATVGCLSAAIPTAPLKHDRYMSKGEKDQILKLTLAQIAKTTGTASSGTIKTPVFQSRLLNYNGRSSMNISQRSSHDALELRGATISAKLGTATPADEDTTTAVREVSIQGDGVSTCGTIKKFGKTSYATVRQPRSLINFRDDKESASPPDSDAPISEDDINDRKGVEAEVDECKVISERRLPPTALDLIEIYYSYVRTPVDFRRALDGTIFRSENEKRILDRLTSRYLEFLYSCFLELYDIEWGLSSYYPPKRFSDLRQFGTPKDDILIKLFYWISMVDLMCHENSRSESVRRDFGSIGKLVIVQQYGVSLFEQIVKDVSSMLDESNWGKKPPKISTSIWLLSRIGSSPKGRKLLSRFLGVLPWSASIILSALWIVATTTAQSYRLLYNEHDDGKTILLTEMVKTILASSDSCDESSSSNCQWCNFICPGDLFVEHPSLPYIKRPRVLERHEQFHVPQKIQVENFFKLLRSPVFG